MTRWSLKKQNSSSIDEVLKECNRIVLNSITKKAKKHYYVKKADLQNMIVELNLPNWLLTDKRKGIIRNELSSHFTIREISTDFPFWDKYCKDVSKATKFARFLNNATKICANLNSNDKPTVKNSFDAHYEQRMQDMDGEFRSRYHTNYPSISHDIHIPYNQNLISEIRNLLNGNCPYYSGMSPRRQNKFFKNFDNVGVMVGHITNMRLDSIKCADWGHMFYNIVLLTS